MIQINISNSQNAIENYMLQNFLESFGVDIHNKQPQAYKIGNGQVT